MSSLQKFHRRTNGVKILPSLGSAAPVANSGFYLGLAGDGTSYMYVAPKSTEVQRGWGGFGTVRGTTSTTDGVTNTNTLYAFGGTTVSGHPAAYYAKSLTTGGYNTWYLPAKSELDTLYANRNATPFATSNAFGDYYWSSTEATNNTAFSLNISSNYSYAGDKRTNGNYDRGVRAIRRV